MSGMTELKKALLSTDAAPLIGVDIDSMLNEELLKIQPLTELLPVVPAGAKTHEYNLRTSHPLAWFEGEASGANNKNSSYQRKSVMLKIARIWGEVTGFTQAVSEKFIDALASELTGSLEGMSNLIEYGALWGASNDIGFSGDAYQFSGIIPNVLANATSNVIDGGGNKIELAELDVAINKISRFRQTRNDPRMFFMGQQMRQVVDGLQTKIQLPLSGATLLDGRVTMAAYGSTPIFESDFLVPEDTSSSPTVSGSIAAGGALADGTYQYKISSVTIYGEQVAGTASGNVVAATTNKKGELTWTGDNAAVSYMIWRKLGAGDFQLLDIIPALTYNASGEITGKVETYTDDGSRTVKAVKPLASGEQNIVIANMNPERGAAFLGLVDDMGQRVDSLVSFVELARTKDAYAYMLKSYFALRMKYANLFAVLRHVKLS